MPKRYEHIIGGLADGMPDSAFDPVQLRRGIEVELEHTGDRRLAKEIAKDHLAEFPNYYTELARMERRMAAKKAKLRGAADAGRKRLKAKRYARRNPSTTTDLISTWRHCGGCGGDRRGKSYFELLVRDGVPAPVMICMNCGHSIARKGGAVGLLKKLRSMRSAEAKALATRLEASMRARGWDPEAENALERVSKEFARQAFAARAEDRRQRSRGLYGPREKAVLEAFEDFVAQSDDWDLCQNAYAAEWKRLERGVLR